jgi:hypothetical protein
MDGKRGVYAVPNLRGAENMEKNGMMQELNYKSKMYLMISSLRQNI